MECMNVGKSVDFKTSACNLYVIAGRAGSGVMTIAERISGLTSAVVLHDGSVAEWNKNIPNFLAMNNSGGAILIDAREIPNPDKYDVAKYARDLAFATNSIVYLVVQTPRVTPDNHTHGDYYQFATGVLIVDQENS